MSQVEFKRHAGDGRYCLMEVNARHWMWHSLATVCGVNLSHVAYADAIGRPYTAPRQVDGPRWALAITDTRDAVREIARGEQTPPAVARVLPRRAAGRRPLARATRCPGP